MCHQIIVLKLPQESAYIKVLEYSNITFTQNNSNNLIVVDIDNENYPFCLFQYVILQKYISHFTIIML